MSKKQGCFFSLLLVTIAADFSTRECPDTDSDSMDLRWKIKLNQHDKTKIAHLLKKIWLTDGCG